MNGFEKNSDEPVHVKHEKCMFVSRGLYSRMRTINLDLIMQKCNRVIQMIIAHISFHIIYILKRREPKIKLRWHWNSVVILNQSAVHKGN